MTDWGRSRDTHTMASNTLPRRALAASLPARADSGLAPTPNVVRLDAVEVDVAQVDVAQVYAAHFKYVWRCLRSLGVPESSLDDAVQEVFLVVQRKLDDFDGASALRTWLYAIVLRVARRHRVQAVRDAIRFQSHDDGVADPESGAPGAPNADLRREIEHQERLLLAQRALAALDDIKREVFVLACIEGMSAPEIATLTGVPLNTVYSRLRAARQAFTAAVNALTSAGHDTRNAP